MGPQPILSSQDTRKCWLSRPRTLCRRGDSAGGRVGTTNKLHPGKHARNTGRTGELILVLATQPGRMDWSYSLQEQAVRQGAGVSRSSSMWGSSCSRVVVRACLVRPREAAPKALLPCTLAGMLEARVDRACPLCSSSNVRAHAVHQSSPWRLLLSPNARAVAGVNSKCGWGSIRRIWVGRMFD